MVGEETLTVYNPSAGKRVPRNPGTEIQNGKAEVEIVFI